MRIKNVVVLYTKTLFKNAWTEILVNMLVDKLKSKKFNVELVSMPLCKKYENSVYDSMLMWKLLDLTGAGGKNIDLVISTGFPDYGVNHPKKVLWLMESCEKVVDLTIDEEKCSLEALDNKKRMRKRINDFEKRNIESCNRVFTATQELSDYLNSSNGILGTVLYHPPGGSERYYSGDFSKYILSVGESELFEQNELLLKSLMFCNHEISAKIVVKETETERLKKRALELNVADRVEILDKVSDEKLIRLYANTSAVYCASQNDAYGYSILKAFFSRKPVISCCNSGMGNEFIEDTKNGYLCEPIDRILGKRIELLLENEKLCKDLGQYGYEWIRDINWEHIINNLTEGI